MKESLMVILALVLAVPLETLFAQQATTQQRPVQVAQSEAPPGAGTATGAASGGISSGTFAIAAAVVAAVAVAASGGGDTPVAPASTTGTR